MSALVAQLSNSVAYALHKATYNPEAEAYAQKQAATEAAAKAAAEKAIADAKSEQEKAVADAKLAAVKAQEEKDAQDKKERERFDMGRLVTRIVSTLLTIVMVFILIMFGVLGASLATNLNLYKDTGYRILYAIYGFLFFFLVIPYVLGYRWWWKGKRPTFYALIPIIPYHFDNEYAAMLFSWMSYKPDCQVESLKEWLAEQAAK